jgi:hypothetical protein
MRCDRCAAPLVDEPPDAVRCRTCGWIGYRPPGPSQSPSLEYIASHPPTEAQKAGGGTDKILAGEGRSERTAVKIGRSQAETLARRILEGASMCELARELGCHYDTLRNAWRRHHIPNPNVTLGRGGSPERMRELREKQGVDSVVGSE